MIYEGNASSLHIGQKIDITDIFNDDYPIENVQAVKQKPGFKPRKDKRHGAENRQPTGDRERNAAHPNAEEHSRVRKGNNTGQRRIEGLDLQPPILIPPPTVLVPPTQKIPSLSPTAPVFLMPMSPEAIRNLLNMMINPSLEG